MPQTAPLRRYRTMAHYGLQGEASISASTTSCWESFRVRLIVAAYGTRQWLGIAEASDAKAAIDAAAKEFKTDARRLLAVWQR